MARFWISQLPPADLPLGERCGFIISLAFIYRNIEPTAAELAELLGTTPEEVIAAIPTATTVQIEGDENGYRVNVAKFAADAKGAGLF